MKLQDFFNVAIGVMFSKTNINNLKPKEYHGFKSFRSSEEAFDNTFIMFPAIYAKNGFSISLQLSNGHYCASDKGYRILSNKWESVEYGFPSFATNTPKETILKIHELLEIETDPDYCPVGQADFKTLEAVFALNGGIDWERTLSYENLFLID